ncbi:hypothetical protein E3E12_08285 [Formicincola oecophyllae]|uniref:SHOCT domain-containing protein n=1 Tax=Formicincola oecophyllae TaxID=2558361 RepID=A0A4Y6UAP5_9PROT|nr:hypothetical protein E3E12_08285 [Formicincola oecophyllae]
MLVIVVVCWAAYFLSILYYLLCPSQPDPNPYGPNPYAALELESGGAENPAASTGAAQNEGQNESPSSGVQEPAQAPLQAPTVEPQPRDAQQELASLALLQQYAALHAQGVLTDAEFERKKAELLQGN